MFYCISILFDVFAFIIGVTIGLILNHEFYHLFIRWGESSPYNFWWIIGLQIITFYSIVLLMYNYLKSLNLLNFKIVKSSEGLLSGYCNWILGVSIIPLIIMLTTKPFDLNNDHIKPMWLLGYLVVSRILLTFPIHYYITRNFKEVKNVK